MWLWPTLLQISTPSISFVVKFYTYFSKTQQLILTKKYIEINKNTSSSEVVCEGKGYSLYYQWAFTKRQGFEKFKPNWLKEFEETLFRAN